MFSRKFKKHGLLLFTCSQPVYSTCYSIFYFLFSTGVLHLSTYLQVYKVGDIVDIKVTNHLLEYMSYKYLIGLFLLWGS